MFSPDQRDRVRERVLEWARNDSRVVAGAIIGSTVDRGGDRWSDLDLTFAIEDATAIAPVLAEWSTRVAAEFNGTTLFDLQAGSAIYRVFLLPGCLQFDLSFSPAAQFGAVGPKFQLLFGHAVEKPFVGPPPAAELFAYAVHHAVRARICVERGRYCQAEYWISALRDHALALACRRRGLSAYFGRGFDDLPDEPRTRSAEALVRSLDRAELLRALTSAIGLLMGEAAEATELAARLEPCLTDLTWRSSDVDEFPL